MMTVKRLGELDVEREVKRDVAKRIELNEMNNIHFYDIQQIPDANNKSSTNHNATSTKSNKSSTKHAYHSRRFPSDLALIRGTKFFNPPSYNEFEKERIKEIKKQPGKHLFLNEMY